MIKKHKISTQAEQKNENAKRLYFNEKVQCKITITKVTISC